MTIGNAWGNFILDVMLNRSTETLIALHKSDPGIDGSPASEITGGSYERKPVDWTAAASRTTTTASDVIFDNMPKCRLTHVSVWRDIAGGMGDYKMITSAAFPSPVSVALSNRVIIKAGDFTVSL